MLYPLPKVYSHCILKCARTFCATERPVFLQAPSELYVNFNLKDWHWALMRVMFKFQRVEIYDSTGHTKTKHERLRRHRVRTRRWMVNLRRHLSRTAPPCATFPTRP